MLANGIAILFAGNRILLYVNMVHLVYWKIVPIVLLMYILEIDLFVSPNS